MKTIILLSVLGISQVYAAEAINITIPYPRHHTRYYGSLADQLKRLESGMRAKAIEACGSEDNLSYISNIQIRLGLQGYDPASGPNGFEGSYPLSGLEAKVFCYE